MNSTLITRIAALKAKRADSQGLRLRKYWLALLALVLLVSPKPSFGQSTSQVASGDDGGAAQPTPAEITKELEAMKARIEQLEAELKTLKTQANSSPAVVQASPAPSGGISATYASGSPGAPAAAADFKRVPGSEFPQAESAKPANVEPFSDYDWTWLNGTRERRISFGIRSSSRPRSEPMSTSCTTSITRRIIRWADRASSFGPRKSSSNNLAWAATSTLTMFAQGS